MFNNLVSAQVDALRILREFAKTNRSGLRAEIFSWLFPKRGVFEFNRLRCVGGGY